MNLRLTYSIGYAALRALFVARGDTRAVQELDKLNEAKTSGANVDAQMQRVADDLNNDVPIDWDDVDAERQSAVDAFLGGGASDEGPTGG